MRAIVDLVLVERRDGAYLARVTGLSLEETAGVVEEALNAWQSTYPFESADDVLRRDEIWMDDGLVNACRDAIWCEAAVGQRRTPPILPNADVPRVHTVRAVSRRRFALGAVLAAVAAMAIWVASSWTLLVSVTAMRISTATPSTHAVPSATPSLDGPNLHIEPGYMFDQAPAGYQLTSWQGASNQEAMSVSGWLQLWAESAADSVHGRWFASVTVCPVAKIGPTPDSSRVGVNAIGTVTSETMNGIVHLSVGSTPTVSGTTNSVSIDAHGYSIDKLRALAAQFVLDKSAAGCGSAAFTSQHKPGFAVSVTGMDLLIDRPVIGTSPQDALAPSDRRYAVYARPGHYDDLIVVLTAHHDQANTLLARFLGPASPGPDAHSTASTTVNEGGRTYKIDHLPADATTIRWDEGNNSIIIASSTQNVDQLVGLAATARLVTPNEWNAPTARLVIPTRNQPAATSYPTAGPHLPDARIHRGRSL